MATFKAGEAFRARMDKVDISGLQRGQWTNRAETSFRIVTDGTEVSSFKGYNFSYRANGAIDGGTVTSYSEEMQGIPSFRFTGLSINVQNMAARVLAGDGKGFLSLLLSKNDSVYGSPLNDYLIGFAGRDVVKAAGGDDTLAGGAGNDTLYGGAGSDSFVFDIKDTGRDRIADFSTRSDRVLIDRPGGKAKVSDDSFVYGSQALDSNDKIVYDKAKGAIYYDADGTGYRPQITIANVKAGLHLTADNFLFI
ncbi:calcium-binding protein [Microvirga sp. BT688]|uniref:calcium-binding protein n=1 Tax=Microvirga sp. TaxID=1873136 RepID=UPI001686C123|nr:calcium-binding protein [Microvirga sp.]MBD2745801.1 calcium-binding protein [Microvirga sp.]